jgi:hypothetical protein
MRISVHASIGFVLLSAAGCLGDFRTPSAYQDQKFLCDPVNETAYRSLVDGCRMGAACAGAFSMKGSLQGDPLTVGTTLSDAAFSVVQESGKTEQQWDKADMTGASPYFQFVFHLKSIGGVVGMGMTDQRTLKIRGGANRVPNPLADDQIDVNQALEAGNASAEEPGLTDSGTVEITLLSPTEMKGSFHGNFGSTKDTVDGCFDMFPLKTVVNPSPTP